MSYLMAGHCGCQYDAAGRVFVDHCVCPSSNTQSVARAAQVAILREIAADLNAAGNTRPANEAKGWHLASDRVADKADELEAKPCP